MLDNIDLKNLSKEDTFRYLQELEDLNRKYNNEIDVLGEALISVSDEIEKLTKEEIEHPERYSELNAGLAMQRKIYLLRSEFCDICREIEKKNILIDQLKEENDMFKTGSDFYNEFTPNVTYKPLNDIKKGLKAIHFKAKLKTKSFARVIRGKAAKFVGGQTLGLSVDMKKKLTQNSVEKQNTEALSDSIEANKDEMVLLTKLFRDFYKRRVTEPDFRLPLSDIKNVQRSVNRTYGLAKKIYRQQIQLGAFNSKEEVEKILDNTEILPTENGYEVKVGKQMHELPVPPSPYDLEQLAQSVKEEEIEELLKEEEQKLDELVELTPEEKEYNPETTDTYKPEEQSNDNNLEPEEKEYDPETTDTYKPEEQSNDNNLEPEEKEYDPETTDTYKPENQLNINDLESLNKQYNEVENSLSLIEQDLQKALTQANELKIKYGDKFEEINEDQTVVQLKNMKKEKEAEKQELAQKIEEIQTKNQEVNSEISSKISDLKDLTTSMTERETELNENKQKIEDNKMDNYMAAATIEDEIRENAKNRDSVFAGDTSTGVIIEDTVDDDIKRDVAINDIENQNAELEKQRAEITTLQETNLNDDLDKFVSVEQQINNNDNLTNDQKRQLRSQLWEEFDDYTEENENTKGRAR